MTEPDNITDEDRAAEQLVTTVCGGPEQKLNTISLAKRALADGVPGDFAECGVCAGTQPALMAYVLQRYGFGGRKVHLFDSFEKGFSVERVHTAADVGADISVCEPSGEGMTTVRQVQDNMRRWRVNEDLLRYHVGYVQETLPALKAAGALPALALLRLDVDFFSPTAFIFDYLYERVSPGGYVISDDWGEYDLDHPDPSGCRLAAQLYFEKHKLPMPRVERVSRGTVWWRKP